MNQAAVTARRPRIIAVLRRLLLLGTCLLGLAFLGMAVGGRGTYTSLGIDLDRAEGRDWVRASYWRIRWPGDGTFRVGYDSFRHPRDPHRDLEAFDWGGRFFLPPRPQMPPRTMLNQMGFWWIRHATGGAMQVRQMWLGVPAFLPGLLLLLPFAAVIQRRRGRATARNVNASQER